MSGWSAWSICSNGTSFRGRIVISHPLGGGQSCPSLRENRICGSVNNQLLANGTRQSPIDLADSRRSGTLVFDEALRHEPLTFIYNPKDMKSLQNVGSTFKMGVTDNAISSKNSHSYVNANSLNLITFVILINIAFQAGHIKRPYSLLEMHGHWGSSRTNGSEHTVNGQGYAAEVRSYLIFIYQYRLGVGYTCFNRSILFIGIRSMAM